MLGWVLLMLGMVHLLFKHFMQITRFLKDICFYLSNKNSKKKNLFLSSLSQNFLAEPIGGAAPKFSSDSKTLGNFEKSSKETLALLCPAQASPLPSFR